LRGVEGVVHLTIVFRTVSGVEGVVHLTIVFQGAHFFYFAIVVIKSLCLQ